jgi:C4-dicarboxylate transporter DctQ subunit
VIRRVLARADEVATGVLMVALVAIVALQVLFRYLFYQPMGWTEEAGRYVFIWLCLLGAAVGVKHRAHFGVDLLIKRLGPVGAARALALIDGLGIGFCGVLTWFGGALVLRTLEQTSPGLDLPMGVPYLALPLGGVLMITYFVRHLRDDLRRGAE